MLKSMTGFGRASYEGEDFSVKVEIKTVNNRYTDVSIRLPRFLNPLEDRIRKQILQGVNRGKADVFITADYRLSDNCSLKVDKPLAQAYHKALEEIGGAIDADGAVINKAQEILYLARTQDVIKSEEGLFDVENVWPKVSEVVGQALDGLVQMRTTEGENIKADFLSRADLILQLVEEIEKRSPLVVKEYQEKLHQRLTELLDSEKIKVDPDRMLQEVAIFADRTAVNEETIRLRSHVKQFKQFLNSDGPVGRKMDFLIQEFNREANTIGSKANDYTMAQYVVDLKAEIEKIREQVQNIE